MKTVSALAVFAVLAAGAHAQLATLPPPSSTDGVPVQNIGVNAGATHWENPSTLGAYRISGDTFQDPLTPGAPDSHLGLVWAKGVNSSAASAKAAINVGGGTIRAISLVGESAGWLNDFGYTYTGNPAGPRSFSVLNDIQTTGGSPTAAYGQYVDVRLGIGEAASFDFWLNGSDSFTAANPPGPTTNGGVYSIFNQASSLPFLEGGNALWAQSAILVNTWVPALGAYADVATYLVSIEDWRLDRGADRDYSDLRIALQFYNANGLPFGPVPEPSTYGLIGAAALLGLVAFRRFKAKKTSFAAA